MAKTTFAQRLSGGLIGGAIGDGMGGPVEGWPHEKIWAQFSGHAWTTFIRPQDGWGKGDGHITDDTLMVEALMRAYNKARRHLDAYDWRDYLIPEYVDTPVWVPEKQRTMPLLERLNSVERYAYIRLRHFHCDPRTAGVGNCLTCALAMCIYPVGAVNAGDPEAAYQETVALGQAEATSYALEGAAILAVAQAVLLGGGSIGEALRVARDLAQDGTRLALEAVLRAVNPKDDVPTVCRKLRGAFEPYDHKRGVPIPAEMNVPQIDQHNMPSPWLALEEPPIALGLLAWSEGDFLRTLQAGVCYGRDCDSIAGMACGLAGSLGGIEAIPAPLREALDRANQRDFVAQASEFDKTIRAIADRDAQRWQARSHALRG